MEQQIWQTYMNDDFILYGINFGESQPTVEEWIENLGVTFPILLDSSGQTYQTYRIPGCVSPFPNDYIIDQEGLIAYKACEFFPDVMIDVIDSLLTDTASVEPTVGQDLGRPSIELLRPNPVSSQGEIIYILPEAGLVRVDILDVSGRRIRSLSYGRRVAGPHLEVWDGRDGMGERVSAGTYVVRVAALGQVTSRKVSVIR